MSERPPEITVPELVERYDAFLLDAYGVLVDSSGPLDGAEDLLERFEKAGKHFSILTNDASRSVATWAERLRGFGLAVPTDRILTSGALLTDYFAEHRLGGTRCVVLGPKDSVAYVENAGGVAVAPQDPEVGAIVVCDDRGYPFLEMLDAIVTLVFRKLDDKEPIELILPNPDLIYPKGAGAFGVTSGGVALIVEAAMQRRYGQRAPTFVPLGKPHAPIFENAMARAGSIPRDRVVMLGDQLDTDIAGARGVGIDSVLMTTGLSRVEASLEQGAARPSYVLTSLR